MRTHTSFTAIGDVNHAVVVEETGKGWQCLIYTRKNERRDIVAERNCTKRFADLS